MNSTTLVTILAGGGLTGVIGAALNAVVNRRKLGADASKVIQEAAGSMVEIIRKDNVELRLRISELTTEVEAMKLKMEGYERREREHMNTLQTHATWDWRMEEQARTATDTAGRPLLLIPVPPLWPPRE